MPVDVSAPRLKHTVSKMLNNIVPVCSQTLSVESNKEKYSFPVKVSQFTKEFGAHLSLDLPSLFVVSISNQNLKTFHHYNILHSYAIKSVRGD